MAAQMILKLLVIKQLLLIGIRSEESGFIRKNTTDTPIDNSFNFDEFDQNGQNKVISKCNE